MKNKGYSEFLGGNKVYYGRCADGKFVDCMDFDSLIARSALHYHCHNGNKDLFRLLGHSSR